MKSFIEQKMEEANWPISKATFTFVDGPFKDIKFACTVAAPEEVILISPNMMRQMLNQLSGEKDTLLLMPGIEE